jgi:hypothetical protein
MLGGTLSVPELIWTLGALVGLIVTLGNIYDAIEKIRTIETLEINGVRRYVVITSLITYSGKALVMLLFFMLGAYTAFQPNAPTTWDLPTIFFLTTLLGAEFILVATAIIQKYRYSKLYYEMLKHERGPS